MTFSSKSASFYIICTALTAFIQCSNASEYNYKIIGFHVIYLTLISEN